MTGMEQNSQVFQRAAHAPFLDGVYQRLQVIVSSTRLLHEMCLSHMMPALCIAGRNCRGGIHDGHGEEFRSGPAGGLCTPLGQCQPQGRSVPH